MTVTETELKNRIIVLERQLNKIEQEYREKMTELDRRIDFLFSTKESAQKYEHPFDSIY